MPSLPPCPDEPDEEVLSTRVAAEAHRMVKLCHLAGIVKPCGHGRKLTLRPGAAAIALTLTLTLTLTRYGDGGRGGSRPGVGVLGGNPRPGGPSPVNPRPGGLSPSSKTMPMTMTMPAPMTTMTMTMPMRSSSSSSSSRPRRSSSSSCSSSSSRGAAARQQQQRAAAGAAAATTALRALSCCRVCHRVCGGDRWSPMPRGLCHRSNLIYRVGAGVGSIIDPRPQSSSVDS